MAFAVITSTEKCIEVNYGVYAGLETSNGIAPLIKNYHKKNVEISQRNDGVVEAWLYHLSQQIPLTYNLTPSTFKIDTVNGVAPIDNNHLYQLLKSIME